MLSCQPVDLGSNPLYVNFFNALSADIFIPNCGLAIFARTKFSPQALFEKEKGGKEKRKGEKEEVLK